MQYYSPEAMADVRAAFEAMVTPWPHVRITRMFGFPCYRADGTLFAVLVTGAVVLTKLPENTRRGLPTSLQATPFEAAGRKMKAWVRIPAKTPQDLSKLAALIQESYESAVAARG